MTTTLGDVEANTRHLSLEDTQNGGDRLVFANLTTDTLLSGTAMFGTKSMERFYQGALDTARNTDGVSLHLVGDSRLRRYLENKELLRAIDEHCDSVLSLILAMLLHNPMVCCVFDIDETVILNDDANRTTHVNPPIRRLYKKLIEHGIPVFFITGRVMEAYDATVELLREYGYDNYVELFCKPTEFYGTSPVEDIAGGPSSVTYFKTACRLYIERCGYKVVFCCGDQASDLGDFGSLWIKVPAFYNIP